MPTLRQVQTENVKSFNTRERLTLGQKCLKFVCFIVALCPLIFFYIMIRSMQKEVKNDAARGWYLYWLTSLGLLIGLPLMVFLSILLYRKCGLDSKCDYPGFADYVNKQNGFEETSARLP